MKRLWFMFSMLLALSFTLQGQINFSDSLEVFARQVPSRLNALGTEPAKKVAYDFANSWTNQLTSEQQQDIHQMALSMQKKGYAFNPYFWYYFSYIAYATTQANLNSGQLSEVLAMNKSVLNSMSKGQYQNFLLGLSHFMARRLLSQTNNLLMVTDNGSFTFKMLDEVLVAEPEPIEEIQPEEEIEVPVVEELAADDPWAQDADPWAQNDDPWAQNDDPWGDSNSSYQDDNWVDSDETWGYDDTGEVFEEKQERRFVEVISQDYVGAAKSKYLHPTVTGPIVALENNSMAIITPYDSFLIKEVDGEFLLATREFAGEKATINWPLALTNHQGAVVQLGQFRIRPDRSEIWTSNAKLTHEKYFEGQLEGVFEFRSPRRRPNNQGDYPRFMSYRSNIQWKLPDEKTSFKGGIYIHGDRLSGQAVSREKGVLTLLDGHGNKVIFRGLSFDFNADSTIVSKDASITIQHGRDSVFHPSVHMNYNSVTGDLYALRNKAYSITPFTSTYFQMNIGAELFKWNMREGSPEFSLLNGKQHLAMPVESQDFFSVIRFKKLFSGMPFHPVVTSVYYANQFGTRQFAADELATAYKVPINQVQGAMKVLRQFGFADYDRETGLVNLKDKAYFYYDAIANKVDYDNILISSQVPGKANAVWNLDSGYLELAGVDKVFLTTDFKVFVEPDSAKVRIGENRTLLMNGLLNAGEFHYRGHDFKFNYDDFSVSMPQIDSIRIELTIPDSLRAEGGPGKRSLNNHLSQTSGTLYINEPNNKSGFKQLNRYPDFLSESEAVVYFDGPEILQGAYDKSVKFIIPPFETDSLSEKGAIAFGGRFNSGGIFPTFEDTLRLMPDQSLGFVHSIPEEGYNLYGTAAKTYEKITLSNMGMRGGGKIDFITSTIFSRDFIYYPDSVASVGRGGVIRPGDANGSSYPEAVLGPYRMHWEPRIDSMNLRNLRQPFQFYQGTATLDGAVNITSRGVFGIGTMLTRGSKSISDELTFKEKEYSARHASFEVLTDNPLKPAMAGDDISLNFDLTKNTAIISPEQAGVAALSFPYAQMKTSITRALWDLEDSTVTMTKPADVPLANSYFYTTRPELDSLAFNAEKAVYDFNTKKLNIQGIPFIRVADAKIIPDGNETTILENARLQTFNNAELIIDTLNGYHHLYGGELTIISRNEFVGSAKYQLTTSGKNYAINFNSFILEEVFKNGKPKLMTVSGGAVLDKENIVIAPGFYFKGNVKMYADKKSLDLSGFVKPTVQLHPAENWIRYDRKDENPMVAIDLNTAVFEDESPVIAGLHYDIRGNLYTSFLEKRKADSDEDLFLAKGQLKFDTVYQTYKVENPLKTSGENYAGSTMIYDDSTKQIVFEGPVQFFSPFTQKVKVNGSVLGTGDAEKNEFNIDAMLSIDFPGSREFMDIMALDLLDLVERLGPPLANELSIEFLYKLANLLDEKTTKSYEAASLKEYRPLVSSSQLLEKPMVVSGVKMTWSPQYRSWYNTTKLAISNIYQNDINAKMDGFLEIQKDDSNNDVLNIFLQLAPGTWYFISYASNTLLFYSSNQAFNDMVTSKSNFGKAGPEELVLVLGDENETLSFINAFRSKYFGIDEAYNLVYPEEINLEDESFETIEKTEDDGFGF